MQNKTIALYFIGTIRRLIERNLEKYFTTFFKQSKVYRKNYSSGKQGNHI